LLRAACTLVNTIFTFNRKGAITMSWRIPRPVFFLCILLLLFGTYLTITLIFNPAGTFPGFNLDTAVNVQVETMLAGRFFSMVVVLAIALALRSAPLLTLVLLMRFLTEAGDSFAAFRTGSATRGYSIIVVAMCELVALIWLARGLKASRVAVESSSAS
jgi:hypothetical protein